MDESKQKLEVIWVVMWVASRIADPERTLDNCASAADVGLEDFKNRFAPEKK